MIHLAFERIWRRVGGEVGEVGLTGMSLMTEEMLTTHPLCSTSVGASLCVSETTDRTFVLIIESKTDMTFSSIMCARP